MPLKKDFLARISEKLDLPRESLPGGFSVFLTGENEATVRGCGRILRYEAALIALSVGKRVLSVCGEDLICSAYGSGTVVITGKIKQLSLEEVGA